ncbi:MAG: deoxyribose-phosphate aldolase [Ardenticatenia bacterium]|nr:deoxyribose-phosphate aldolase [Ardenticatenia bacterium]
MWLKPHASPPPPPPTGAPSAAELARSIDHTKLSPDATRESIRQLCNEARQYGFAAVCVNPVWVAFCAEELAHTDVAVCTVVGFPLGAHRTETKVRETELACHDGASEVDMVIHVGALKGGDLERVAADIAAVTATAHAHGALVKVILEVALLTEHEKIQACALCDAVGADYVKTSTGFGPGGATPHDVALLRRHVSPSVGVKAAGGIKSYEDALTMLRAGASRLGASAGVAIVRGAPSP